MEKAGAILMGTAVLIGCGLFVYEAWQMEGAVNAIASAVALLFIVGAFLWFLGN